MSEKSAPHFDDLTPALTLCRDKDGAMVCMMNLDEFETPGIWGIVVADVVKHLVNAYTARGFSPRAVHEEIVHFLVSELENPSDKAINITDEFEWGEE